MKSILACFGLLFANVMADDALFLPISNADGSQIGTLAVNKNQEPADAVHQFMVQHNLAEEFRATMMEHVCAVVKCNRVEPGEMANVFDVDGTCSYSAANYLHLKSYLFKDCQHRW